MTKIKLQRPGKATPELYAQDGLGYRAIAHEHYFLGGSDWFVTEYDAEDDIAFGWACLNGDREMAELGYISMAELDEVRAMGVFPVERDAHWTPCTLTEAIKELDRRQGRES